MAIRRARDNDLIAIFFLTALNANYWRTLSMPLRLNAINKTAAKSSNRAIDYAKDALESIRAVFIEQHSSGSIKTVSLGVVTLAVFPGVVTPFLAAKKP